MYEYLPNYAISEPNYIYNYIRFIFKRNTNEGLKALLRVHLQLITLFTHDQSFTSFGT